MYTLTRILSNNTATYGVLSSDILPLVVTLELPWNNNQPDVSCIPTGIYQVIKHNSPAHPNTWEITNVTDRTGILIHNGNLPSDSLGCVIVGSYYYGASEGIGQSNIALQNLQKWLPDDFELTIKSAYS